MGGRIGLLFLFMLSASWASESRELITTVLSNTETVMSDVSGLQLKDSEIEVQVLEEVSRNENVCTLCEEFVADALKFLAENKTQTEIVDTLHKTCSRMLTFKQECITLVDYYSSLFFSEINLIKPGDFCGKVNLCEQMAITYRAVSEDSCGLCHHAVAEVLLKLNDPDTQLEIIELLLKGCDAVENHVKKCKTLVFRYGPLILANAAQFLETKDICTAIHACSLTASTKQAYSTVKEPMLSAY